MQVSGHNALELDGFEGEAVVGQRSNGKRIFARGFKEALVARCREPGVSVAALAMAHGINANLVRRWMKEVPAGELGKPVKAGMSLMPVEVVVQAEVEAPEKFQAHQATSGPTRASLQPALTTADATSTIEIEAHGACVRLHGDVDARRLSVVLDVLARQVK